MITSSKTSSAPHASHSIRSASRNPGAGGTTPMLPATGSTRIAASPSPYSGDRCRDGVDVVVGQHDRVAGDARRDARGRRDPERHQPRAGAREQRVDVAVVVAGELDQPVAARRGARQPHGAHRGLGAGGDEAHHLDRRHGVHDLGREVDLALGRGAERRPACERIGDGGERLGVGVPEEERPPGEHPVDVAVAVRRPRSARPTRCA